MSAPPHDCAVPDCGARIAAGRLMCFKHWTSLSVDLRREFNDAYHSYERERHDWSSTPEERKVLLGAYFELRAKVLAQAAEA